MYYLLLEEAWEWQVLVPSDADGNCQITFEGTRTVNLEEAGPELAPDDDGVLQRLLANLERLGTNGNRAFSSKKSHIVDKENRIFSVDVGSFRILYCFEDGKVVICCHIYRKKRQKIPPEAVAAAVLVRTQYKSAVANGTLTILT